MFSCMVDTYYVQAFLFAACASRTFRVLHLFTVWTGLSTCVQKALAWSVPEQCRKRTAYRTVQRERKERTEKTTRVSPTGFEPGSHMHGSRALSFTPPAPTGARGVTWLISTCSPKNQILALFISPKSIKGADVSSIETQSFPSIDPYNLASTS